MQLVIGNDPIPEGKVVKKVKLRDAITLARSTYSYHSGNTRVIDIDEEINQDIDYVSKPWKSRRICRRCRRAFVVIKGCKREHSQLCQLCTDLRNQERR